ncbi:MAG: type IV conjugative transfer system protein TraL, partial [Gammaproteobacteria bacterium]|nr:type IV conjugative transfer system protein TraL [Gammaproteobacteria bacterium]
MDIARYMIPRHLDDPPMVFMWEADEAGTFIFLMLFGALFQQFIPGIVLGFFASRSLARIKQAGGRGLILRFLYWYTRS